MQGGEGTKCFLETSAKIGYPKTQNEVFGIVHNTLEERKREREERRIATEAEMKRKAAEREWKALERRKLKKRKQKRRELKLG